MQEAVRQMPERLSVYAQADVLVGPSDDGGSIPGRVGERTDDPVRPYRGAMQAAGYGRRRDI